MPSVTFDVVGTCFSYDNGAKGIEERLGPKLAKYGLTSKVVMYSVVCGTERDYSYLSQIGQYKQFHTIFFGIFRRVLFQLGVPPQDLDDSFLSKDDIDHIYKRYMDLQPRPGLTEMFQILREGGFDVWACSDASVERVRGYFKGANVQIADDHIISADVVGKGKPEAAVYKLAMEKVGGNTSEDVAVFAASHAWDCAAAKAAGFETAYTTTYEWDECVEVFGKFDLVTPDLISLGQGIVDKWGKK